MRRFEVVDDYAPPERFRYPREIVVVYVGAADVDDFLAERGNSVSHETVRLQVNRFGQLCAGCLSGIGLALPTSGISARSLSRSGAVDDNGVDFDLLVQKHRNAKAAMRFLKGVVARFGQPRVMRADKLRSYIKPIEHLATKHDHRAHKGLNNRIER